MLARSELVGAQILPTVVQLDLPVFSLGQSWLNRSMSLDAGPIGLGKGFCNMGSNITKYLNLTIVQKNMCRGASRLKQMPCRNCWFFDITVVE